MPESQTDGQQEVSVTLPREYVEEQLLPQYPAASRPSQAIRMAIQNDVERRKQAITPASIRDSVIEALERSGGSVESINRVIIGDVDELEVEEAEDVTVNSSE